LKLSPDALPKEVRAGGALQFAADVAGTLDRLQINSHVDGAAADLAYSTSPTSNGFVKTAGIPMAFGLTGVWAGGKMDIGSLKFTLSKLEAEGSGTYQTGPAPRYLFNIRTDSFPLADLARMVPMMQEYGLKGNAVASVKVVSSPKGPLANGTFVLQDGVVHYTTAELSQVAATVDFSQPDANSYNTSGHLTADQVKHDYYNAQALEVKWNLTDLTPDLAKLNGTANLKQGAGQVQNIQKLVSDSKAAKIVLLPLSLLQKLSNATHGAIQLPPMDNVKFKDILGDYVFKSGVMNIKSFTMDGDEINAAMNGTIGLAGPQPLDLKATLKFAAGLVGGTVGDLLQDEQGRPTVNMTVKGTVSDPKSSVDTAAVKKQAVEKIKEKLADPEVQQKIQDLFKGIFK